MSSLNFCDELLPRTPRILFMGTPDFATPALRALYAWCTENGGELVGVVSQPDRPKGRGRQLMRTPVASVADELGVTCYQWPKLCQESYDVLSELKYDLAVVIAYGKILPRRYLTLPPWGCINLHASLLPAYRGAAPIQWALIHGEKETGVSVMRLDEGMDTGPVAHMLRLEVTSDDTSVTLFERLAMLSAQALVETLDCWIDPNAENPVQFEPQSTEGVSYASMLCKEDGVLDWNKSSYLLGCQVRGVTPWPGGQVTIHEGVLKVLEVETWDEAQVSRHLSSQKSQLQDSENTDDLSQLEKILPGTIIDLLSQGPLIRCGEGALLLTRTQRPSKKATSGGDFCRGYPLRIGALLSEC